MDGSTFPEVGDTRIKEFHAESMALSDPFSVAEFSSTSRCLAIYYVDRVQGSIYMGVLHVLVVQVYSSPRETASKNRARSDYPYITIGPTPQISIIPTGQKSNLADTTSPRWKQCTS